MRKQLSAATRPRTPAVLVGIAIFVLALNLRMGIASVGPVLPLIVHDLRTSLVYGSLLTTGPVIMMGLVSPFSARLAARFGVEWTIVAALVVLGMATAVRVWTVGPWMLLLSALALGAGIAAGNTMLPAVVGTYFPARGALMTGLYTVGMNAGAGAAAYGSPRLAHDLDSTWRGALAVWSVAAVIAALLWVVIAARTRRTPPLIDAPLRWRTRQTAMVALLFGLQSMAYYGVLAWLAPLYEDHGWSSEQAGLLLSLLTGTQMVGSITVALAVQRTGRLADGLRAAGIMCGVATALVAITPMSAPWLWAILLGLGSGGIFTLALTVPLQVTASVDGARRLTGQMLCYGYLMAATGPFVVSILRSLLGGFLPGFLLLACLCFAAAIIAGRVVGSHAETVAA